MDYSVPNEFIIYTNNLTFDDYVEKYQVRWFDQDGFDEAGGFETGAKYNHFTRSKYTIQQLRNMHRSRDSSIARYTRYLEEQIGEYDIEIPEEFVIKMNDMRWVEYRNKYWDDKPKVCDAKINVTQLRNLYSRRITSKKQLYIRYLQSLISSYTHQ